jgi:hypothetical protein
VYERERERDAARLLVAAASKMLDEAHEQRRRYVERNRPRMLKAAPKDADALARCFTAKVREMATIRDELLTARDLVAWTATYPSEQESWGFPTALALGLQEPVRRTLQTSERLDFGSVIAALEEDAAALASRFGPQTMQALGDAPSATPVTETMWSSDPRHKAWAKEPLENARQLAEYGNPHQLAREADEFRRDAADGQ